MDGYWNKTLQELKEEFHISEKGLSSTQAEEIRKQAGENLLAESKKKSILAVFMSQFRDLLVMILIVAAIISMFSRLDR